MEGLQELTNALSNGTIPDPLCPPFLEIGGLQLSYPLLSQELVKRRTSNLTGTCTGPIRIKAYQIFQRKGGVGVSRDSPNFFGYPLLSQERVKLRISNFEGTFIRWIRTKAHEKCWEQQPWAQSGVPKILSAPCIGRIARSSLRQHSFLVVVTGLAQSIRIHFVHRRHTTGPGASQCVQLNRLLSLI